MEGEIKKNPNLLKVTENPVYLTMWKVGRYWRDGKREPGKVRFSLARAASKKFFSVDLLVCARSHLSAHSVHVALLDFKFAESLAIPIGAGSDTPGWEFFPGSENALWLHMVIDRDFEFSKLNGSQVQVFHPCSTLVKLRTMSRLLRSGFASLLPLGSGPSLLHSPQ